MESVVRSNPKDEHILNKDDSVTNKDGDNYLEKGKAPIDQKNSDTDSEQTVIADNDNKKSEPSTEEKPVKKDSISKGYAL